MLVHRWRRIGDSAPRAGVVRSERADTAEVDCVVVIVRRTLGPIFELGACHFKLVIVISEYPIRAASRVGKEIRVTACRGAESTFWTRYSSSIGLIRVVWDKVRIEFVIGRRDDDDSRRIDTKNRLREFVECGWSEMFNDLAR